jgi:glucose 1-dehydrogenase
MRLGLCASADSPELASLKTEAEAQGAQVLTLSGDLGDPAVPAALVAGAVDAFGGLDAVISNAGIAVPGLLKSLSVEDWDRIHAVNLRGPWLLAQAAYPHLAATRGVLVAVASMSGVEPYPGTGTYSPSKAGLIMLVRQLAQEWAEDGIRVNAVSPGLFRTAMTAPIYADAEKTAAREALVPMHRIGNPDQDLAGLVEFLISADATYLTGQNIVVDGGLLGSIQTHLAGRPKSGGAVA